MNAYHYIWHTTQPDGRIVSRHETNDDNDDGWSDGDITQFTLGPTPKESALRSPYNRSHIGCSGVHVYVYLDGKEIT